MRTVFPRVDRVAEHSFLADELGPSATVVDLGFNKGAFSLGIAKRYQCNVVAAEPLGPPGDLRIPAGIDLASVAILDCDGEVDLFVPDCGCASTTSRILAGRQHRIKVEAMTLETFLTRQGVDEVSLLKLDIEGAELAVLRSAGPELLRRIQQITVEFHDFLDASMSTEVREVTHHLARNGFQRLRFSRDNTDVLFVNTRLRELTGADRLFVTARYKYPRGLIRFTSRFFASRHR